MFRTGSRGRTVDEGSFANRARDPNTGPFLPFVPCVCVEGPTPRPFFFEINSLSGWERASAKRVPLHLPPVLGVLRFATPHTHRRLIVSVSGPWPGTLTRALAPPTQNGMESADGSHGTKTRPTL